MPAIQTYLILHWVEEPDEGKSKIQSFQDHSTAQETPISVLLFKLKILGKFRLLILNLVKKFATSYLGYLVTVEALNMIKSRWHF